MDGRRGQGGSTTKLVQVCKTGLRAVTLRLRPKNHVKWGDDVVDNEGMGKRKSNKCCIFYKRKKFGESSSDSDCSSGSDSGANSGSGSPRRRSSDSAVSRNRRAKCICEPQQGQAAAINIPASLNRGTDGPGALRGWITAMCTCYHVHMIYFHSPAAAFPFLASHICKCINVSSIYCMQGPSQSACSKGWLSPREEKTYILQALS
jgi:hypothetical protein